jgi:hypothetical protein
VNDFDGKIIEGTATDGGLALPAGPAEQSTDEPDNSVTAGMAALASAFGGGTATVSAEAILRESPNRVLAIAGNPVRTKKGRSARLACLYDDSSSMEGFWDILMAGHDMMLDMLRAEIAHDSVETLVTADALNGGLIHGYVPLAEAPRLANRPLYGGETLWMKRFGQQLAALGIHVGRADEQGREATGVAFLGTDGWDTEMFTLQQEFPTKWQDKLAERFYNLQQVIKGFVAQGNISAAVAFMGKILDPSNPDYEYELLGIKGARESVGLANPRSMNQEELIHDMFRELGFPEDMIFLPGSDMRRLAQVLAAVSRSMVARSRGARPDGNKGLTWKRH